MIDRRAFVARLGAVLATPFATGAQQTPKLPRVGYGCLNTRTVTVEAFEHGLRQLGYVLGQNIVVDYRTMYREMRMTYCQQLAHGVEVSVTDTGVGICAGGSRGRIRGVPPGGDVGQEGGGHGARTDTSRFRCVEASERSTWTRSPFRSGARAKRVGKNRRALPS